MHAALDHDSATVHLHHRADDGQTQSAAAASSLAGARAPVEALEDVGQLGRVDPDTRVDHLDPGPVSILAERDDDGSATRRELQRVTDEIADHLAESLRVVANHERGLRELPC